jgi:hypothetical protein
MKLIVQRLMTKSIPVGRRPLQRMGVACLIMLLILACNPVRSVTSPDRPSTHAIAPFHSISSATNPTGLPSISRENGTVHVDPLPIAADLRNEWPPELERAFWERANQVIRHYAGQRYGNTFNENEKRSYPLAMFDFLAGHQQKALNFLQSEDAQAQDHQHTAGIDYYFCFTLKGQMRKYFFFGKWLDLAYRQQMFEGAKRWTEQDPATRPHPIYGNGNGQGDDWSMARRGKWVDTRNTDNLRAMREVAVYLMAEETGNESTRQLYKQKLQRYVWALYNIGMGEWDSAVYHGHTFAAYLNLYDFAKDTDMQRLAKAALDWLSAAAALKYSHGGWGGPTKRDSEGTNVVFGAGAARFFWQYFGDAMIPNPEPERDIIHVITSAYRPPLAVMALAQKQFQRPVELLNTKPTYENGLPGRDTAPAYWETVFLGQTYQMGSVVSATGDGDVGPFKVLATNPQRGVDFVSINTGARGVNPGKHRGDQIGQYQNLVIWLSPIANQPFSLQFPKTAIADVDDNIWFFALNQTWLAIHPIHLEAYQAVELPKKQATAYSHEQLLQAKGTGSDYIGFALEVGEPQSHSSYAQFKQAVKTRSRLELTTPGTVQLTSSTGTTLKLTYNPTDDRPRLVRNGVEHHWSQQLALYQPTTGNTPITLGWKQGKLQIQTESDRFTTTFSSDE